MFPTGSLVTNCLVCASILSLGTSEFLQSACLSWEVGLIEAVPLLSKLERWMSRWMCEHVKSCPPQETPSSLQR
jgi:hypothetical protein